MLNRLLNGRKIAWIPHPGSQTLFLNCPADEVLNTGTRGSAKTEGLIVDFLQHVGQGFGINWHGVIFRRTYKQLKDVVKKSKKIIPKIYPDAKFNKSDLTWVFPDGEELNFSYFMTPEDYENYHGQEFPFIGWEEATNWPTSDCYDLIKTCSRSSHPNMPRKIRLTTNPFGAGYQWVKDYFNIGIIPYGQIQRDEYGNTKVVLNSSIYENISLLKADPQYISKLKAITDPNRRKAWLEGSWDILAGGIFSDLWYPDHHVIKPFIIPPSWRIDRSFDWGYSKPFSVNYFAESDGSILTDYDNKPLLFEKNGRKYHKSYPKGTLFHIAEIYGCEKGKSNSGVKWSPKKIAEAIVEMDFYIENEYVAKSTGGYGLLAGKPRNKVLPGPADSSIWDASRGKSIAEQIESYHFDYVGKYVASGYPREWKKTYRVEFTKSDRTPGSRIAGVQLFRQMLDNSLDCYSFDKDEDPPPMEFPGFYSFNTCTNFNKIIPSLPMDEKKLDDVDTTAEDHCWDSVKYRILDSFHRGLIVHGI